MHMASKHARSLAGFKSHGDMRVYAHCCCTPASCFIPTHTQRQDLWDTCRSIFWGAGQKFPLTPHLLWPSHFACSDPTPSQALLMLVTSKQAEAATQLWQATCIHRCSPLCPQQEQTYRSASLKGSMGDVQMQTSRGNFLCCLLTHWGQEQRFLTLMKESKGEFSVPAKQWGSRALPQSCT